jgi:hypothetical protein
MITSSTGWGHDGPQLLYEELTPQSSDGLPAFAVRFAGRTLGTIYVRASGELLAVTHRGAALQCDTPEKACRINGTGNLISC